MNEADNTNEETQANNTEPNPQAQTDPNTHPICQNAKDQDKCEEFVERLGQASDNIDKHED